MTRTVNLKPLQTPKIGIDWNGDLYNPNNSEDYWEANNEFTIEPDNCITDAETPQEEVVSTAPNITRLIPPTQKSMKEAKQVLMTVNTMEKIRNHGIKIT
jgi:hypothetical protein